MPLCAPFLLLLRFATCAIIFKDIIANDYKFFQRLIRWQCTFTMKNQKTISCLGLVLETWAVDRFLMDNYCTKIFERGECKLPWKTNFNIFFCGYFQTDYEKCNVCSKLEGNFLHFLHEFFLCGNTAIKFGMVLDSTFRLSFLFFTNILFSSQVFWY